MRRPLHLVALWLVASLPLGALHAEPEQVPPPEVRQLLPKGTQVLDWRSADLNADGRPDVLLIHEPVATADDGPRTLLIALRQPDGRLTVVKRNDKVVYCRQCGGVFGDPYESIDVTKGRFSVNHYGGSNWRWSNSFSFAYSRRDDTWQLVRVDESSFHTSAPDKMKSRSYKPPRDFGKIDIADFDPDHYKGVGPK